MNIASFYTVLLIAHNWWRWVILAAALVVLVAAVRGLGGTRPFATGARKAAAAFTGALDLQFVFGLALYFLSPLVQGALANFGGSMKVRELRFFMMEHLVFMFLAVALAHIGSVRARKAADDARSHRTLLVWFSISLLLILGGMPWWRPLLRLG